MFHIKKQLEIKRNVPYSTLILEAKEHLIEFQDRINQFFLISLFTFFLALCSINIEVETILRLIPEIQFFQLSPQDFFIASFSLSLYINVIYIYPYVMKNIILFFGPSLLLKEKRFIFPLVGISLTFTFLATTFALGLIAPLTFQFFFKYNLDNIEPFWSFNDFSSFLIKIIFIVILLFQLPLIQILLNILGLFPTKKMTEYWKFIILLSFLVSGILTPSTDPFTQTILAVTICMLYGSGLFFSKIIL